ncbi:MAG: S8 family serine peptidase [Candidatus Cyclobacteriaceae bacterium M3_2C_046]
MIQKKWILLLIFLVSFDLKAQVNRYMVFFSDKKDVPYSITQPEKFLSQRAIIRRIRQNIPVTTKDLPINQSYLKQLENMGPQVFYKSKWLNGVLVQAEASLVPAIEAQPFVSKVEFVAPGRKNNARISIQSITSVAGRKSEELPTDFQNDMLGIDDMHQMDYKGQDMLIAVFDGGFENVNTISYFDHLFSENKLLATYDFINNDSSVFEYDDHGTNVLSCIGAYKPGEYEGTAYRASYVLCVTEDVGEEFRIEEYNWLFAAEMADSLGVDIINSSLGYNLFDDPSMNYNIEEMDGETAVISRAASLAASTGMLVVVSAGNEGNDPNWKYIVPPADADSIIAVGAISNSLARASFSSIGPTIDERVKPDLVALGLGTTIISGSGRVTNSNGTSFAAPLITGLAAGVWQAHPDLTNWELIQLLKNSASQNEMPDNLLGYGIPDFNQAQVLITALNEIEANDFRIYPNPFKDNNFFIQPSLKYAYSFPQIQIYSLSGSLIDQLAIEKSGEPNLYQVNLPDMPNGIYILAIQAEENIHKYKIVKN